MESLPTFIGRREELQSISVAVRECGAQREPRYVLIEGPPGIGKTTLLNQAVAMMSESRRVIIYLDADDRGRAGFAARQLLRKPHRNRARQDREGLQARVQAAADSIEAPIVVAVEDFHWVDTMSADIFFDVIRDMEPVPMFNPVTMRSSDRADLRRFSRLADTKAEAVHCVLAPFTAEEIRGILREATDLPVGMAVARRVQEATDGFPQFVAAVVAWLRAAPRGRAATSSR
ncbi:hypothetical protein GCM10023169_31230 [Georgenia halophila]|uniref:Orc1-like AAA ATPase domain-containing protein n=1 Tax=Georgenia halophila TaxID=620889 RepID=A0ABP8LJA0_9MICO